MIFGKNDNDQEADSGFNNAEVIEIPLLHESSSHLPVVNAELIDFFFLLKIFIFNRYIFTLCE